MTSKEMGFMIAASLRGLRELGYSQPVLEEKFEGKVIVINGKFYEKSELAKLLHNLLLAERSRRAAVAEINWARKMIGVPELPTEGEQNEIPL